MKINEPLRVIIAEDESLIGNLIQRELESVGMKVVGKATDGRQAVEFTRSLRPSVVVMDIAMPELDGIAAAVAIQAQCPTPVVILSAHDTMADVAKATAAGVGAFVAKPAQASELDRAICIAVARHADLMEVRRLNDDLQKALAEVRTLRGLLPMCSGCKKIRDDQGEWNDVEVYIVEHTEAICSHGFCPECAAKFFPGMPIPIPD